MSAVGTACSPTVQYRTALNLRESEVYACLGLHQHRCATCALNYRALFRRSKRRVGLLLHNIRNLLCRQSTVMAVINTLQLYKKVKVAPAPPRRCCLGLPVLHMALWSRLHSALCCKAVCTPCTPHKHQTTLCVAVAAHPVSQLFSQTAQYQFLERLEKQHR